MIHFNNIKFFICILLILGNSYCKGEDSSPQAEKNKQKSSENISIANDRLITVYYFHTTFRCKSCTTIQELTQKALKNNFTNQLKSGKILFKLINIDKDQNKHFIQDYKLFTKSVVLVDLIKGKQKKWKRLDKTWSYLQSPDDFDKYIKDEVASFIKK